MKKIVIIIIVILLGVIGYLSIDIYSLNKKIENKTNWVSDYPKEFQEYLKLSTVGNKNRVDFYGFTEIKQPTFEEHCKNNGQKEKYTNNNYIEYTVETECIFSDEPEIPGESIKSIVDGKYNMNLNTWNSPNQYFYNGKYFIEISSSQAVSLYGLRVFDEEGKEILNRIGENTIKPCVIDSKLYMITFMGETKYRVTVFDLKRKQKSPLKSPRSPWSA